MYDRVKEGASAQSSNLLGIAPKLHPIVFQTSVKKKSEWSRLECR